MAMDRVASSWRGAERRRREAYPQLPPAPEGMDIIGVDMIVRVKAKPSTA